MIDFTLDPYQIQGRDFLASRKVALLADDMRMGKTIQSITAADKIGAKRILVISPSVVQTNWEREFLQFSNFGRKIAVIRGQSHKVWNPEHSIIASYDSCLHVLDPGDFDLVIVDEWHYLKATDTKRATAILSKTGIIRKCKRVWALSGTPAPNHYGELWTLLFTFGRTRMSYEAFVKHFCHTRHTSYGTKIAGNNKARIPELNSLLEPVMLRRKRTEGSPVHFEHVTVDRGPVDIEQTDAFIKFLHDPARLQEMLQTEKLMVDHILRNSTVSSQSMRALEALANSVSTLRRYTGLQKVQPVGDIIADELEINLYEKIVIFAIHKDTIELLRQKLEKYGVLTLYGGTPPEKKQKHIDDFNNKKRKRVFIAQINAAGVGISLSAAKEVVFIEQDWVPGNNVQAAMRVGTRKMEDPVYARVFGLNESYDSSVANLLKRKMKDIMELMNPMEKIISNDSELTESQHDVNNSTLETVTLEELLE